jgi:hypothetical protein
MPDIYLRKVGPGRVDYFNLSDYSVSVGFIDPDWEVKFEKISSGDQPGNFSIVMTNAELNDFKSFMSDLLHDHPIRVIPEEIDGFSEFTV